MRGVVRSPSSSAKLSMGLGVSKKPVMNAPNTSNPSSAFPACLLGTLMGPLC